MRSLLYFFTFLLTSIIYSQDSTKTHIETPKIITNLPLGKTYKSSKIQIKFVDVLTDSRCPKDVTCVWAGQVVVLVDIMQDKTLIEQRELIFQPGKEDNKEWMLLFSSGDIKISAYDVLPYPKSRDKIKKEDYYLQLEIED
jgi:hypothetical protein